jgi:uncharacterized glyoxalase superfamily protein PhnB
MKPTPAGWPRLSSSVVYRDPARMIDWLCEAFGFDLRLKVEGEGGHIEHSELTYGDAVVMASSESSRFGQHFRSPQAARCNTQTLFLYVDDADAHCERARRAGATIVKEPQDTDYGDDYWADRGYAAQDPEGHHWWFAQRLRG